MRIFLGACVRGMALLGLLVASAANLMAQTSDCADRRQARQLRRARTDTAMATSYFITPSGYALPAGQTVYSTRAVIAHSVQHGLTDRWQIGGGLVPLHLLGAEGSPMWVDARYNTHMGVSWLRASGTATVIYLLGDNAGAVAVTGGLTVGTPRYHVTAGGGAGAGVGRESVVVPVARFGAQLGLLRRVRLLGELLLVDVGNEPEGLTTAGLRANLGRFALDFGLLALLVQDSAGGRTAFPYAAAHFPLRRKG